MSNKAYSKAALIVVLQDYLTVIRLPLCPLVFHGLFQAGLMDVCVCAATVFL
jgi:hypothetical protein